MYVHMNFMASSSSYKALQAPQPVCFFAEALRPPRPGYHEDDITLCSIVQPSPTDIGTYVLMESELPFSYVSLLKL